VSRLPTPSSDNGTWGVILNDFLGVEHNSDGTLKASGSLASKGDASGPAIATDKAIARFNSTTGKLIQNSLAKVDDTGNVITPGIADLNGNVVLAPITNATNGNYVSVQASSTTPTIQSAGAGTNIDLSLTTKGLGKVALRPGTDSARAFTITNAASSKGIFNVDTTNGRASVGFPATNIPLAGIHISSYGTSSPQLVLDASYNPGEPTDGVAGGIWNSPVRGLSVTAYGIASSQAAFSTVKFVGIGPYQIANTTAETSVLTNGDGNLILQAPGAPDVAVTHHRFARITVRGLLNTAASSPGTLTVTIKIIDPYGSTNSHSVTTATLPTNVTNQGFSLEGLININNYYDGDTNTTSYSMNANFSHYSGAGTRNFYDIGAGYTSLNTAPTIDVTFQWSVANTNNRLASFTSVLELLN
jgi:hypothetical protein